MTTIQIADEDHEYVLWSMVEDLSFYSSHLLYGLRVEPPADGIGYNQLVQYLGLNNENGDPTLNDEAEILFAQIKSNPGFNELEDFLRAKVISDPEQRTHTIAFPVAVFDASAGYGMMLSEMEKANEDENFVLKLVRCDVGAA